MNTYTINKDKVKICLTEDEVNSLFGGYEMIDYDCPRSKAVLDSLLINTFPDSMLPLDCGRILIEVTEERSGCSIQITRIYDKGKRLHKKGSRHKYILLFNSSEDMVLFIKQTPTEILSTLKSVKLIKVIDKYAIVFIGDSVIKRQQAHFSEYGKLLDSKTNIGSSVLEYGTVICNDASEKLFSAFKN